MPGGPRRPRSPFISSYLISSLPIWEDADNHDDDVDDGDDDSGDDDGGDDVDGGVCNSVAHHLLTSLPAWTGG